MSRPRVQAVVFDAVVFDAVGTLIEPWPSVADVYHLAGWQHGSTYGREELAERFREAFKAIFGSQSRENVSEQSERLRWRQVVTTVFDDVPDAEGALFRTLWDHFARPESWRLYEDVLAATDALHHRGLRLAVASNFDRRLVTLIQRMPIAGYIERCFVSSEVGFAKPDRRFFDSISGQMNLKAEEILMVGDDYENDVNAAQAAGWQALWLNRAGESQQTNESIKSLLELPDLV